MYLLGKFEMSSPVRTSSSQCHVYMRGSDQIIFLSRKCWIKISHNSPLSFKIFEIRGDGEAGTWSAFSGDSICMIFIINPEQSRLELSGLKDLFMKVLFGDILSREDH